jgi:hypothetical protein
LIAGATATEYVPPTFKSAELAPFLAAEGGNVKVTVALYPGSRFVTRSGTVRSATEPSLVPAIVTCAVVIVTLPVFVMVTRATKLPLLSVVNG